MFYVLCSVGCANQVLYNNLAQDDANKVMVLLQQNGINAELEQKIIQNEAFWTIRVRKEDMARARELVVTSQVISPRAPGLKEIYQGKGAGGWIKTPAEERSRYILALKGEIINSLKKLPNVVDVDVVLNIPEEEALGLEKKKHPTASVVIKGITPQAGESALAEIQVQQFVANAVEGMSPRDVSVLLHFMAPVGKGLKPGESVILPKGPVFVDLKKDKKMEEEESPVRLMGLKLDTASKERLKIYLIIFFLILVILSTALIVVIVQTSRTRHELKALRAGGGGGPALPGGAEEGQPRLEAPEKDEEEV